MRACVGLRLNVDLKAEKVEASVEQKELRNESPALHSV